MKLLAAALAIVGAWVHGYRTGVDIEREHPQGSKYDRGRT